MTTTLKTLMVLTCVYFFAPNSSAQRFYIRDLFDFYNDVGGINIDKNKQRTYDQIDGTPYLTEKFFPGNIVINDSLMYEKIPLRYNVYQDHMEFLNRDELVLYLAQPENYPKVIIGNQQFIYTKSDNELPGYYILLAEGDYDLLKKKSIYFREETPAQPFKDPKPAAFVFKPDVYYLKNGKNQLLEIKKTKDLYSVFSDKKDSIKSFIKVNRLNARKEEDLIKIVRYLNTLQS